MPRLSIVIPVLGDPQQLDDTLLSVLENRPVNCEILVVHNQPYHDPYELSDEVRFVEARHGAGMAECVNSGFAVSQSPVVHVLACGVEVGAGWAEVALRQFRDPDVAAVGAVVVDRDDRQKIVSAGLGYRVEGTAWRLRPQDGWAGTADCRHDFCGPDPLAAFYRRSAVEAIGGFSTWAGDLQAGIDAALALRQAGFRCVLEPKCVARVGGGTLHVAPAFRAGCHAERLFWRWASSQGWLPSLAGHAALLAGQCVMGLWRPSMLVQLVGRACGMLQAMLSKHRPIAVEEAANEQPSVIAAPHFALARARKEQWSNRVA